MLYLLYSFALILGVVYLFRRPKISELTAENFPHVDSEKFAAWQKLELKSIDLFLWVTGCTFVIRLFYPSIENHISDENRQVIPVVVLIIWFIGVIVSGVYGMKARKLKKKYLLLK